jgi:hypothetical protein
MIEKGRINLICLRGVLSERISGKSVGIEAIVIKVRLGIEED